MNNVVLRTDALAKTFTLHLQGGVRIPVLSGIGYGLWVIKFPRLGNWATGYQCIVFSARRIDIGNAIPTPSATLIRLRLQKPLNPCLCGAWLVFIRVARRRI